MRNMISSIMDTRKKRLGFVIISIMSAATACTGFALAASVNAANTGTNENAGVTVVGNNDKYGSGNANPSENETGNVSVSGTADN